MANKPASIARKGRGIVDQRRIELASSVKKTLAVQATTATCASQSTRRSFHSLQSSDNARVTGYTEVIPVGWKTRISWKWPGLFDQVKRGKHPLYICVVWRDVLERGKELAVTVRDSNKQRSWSIAK